MTTFEERKATALAHMDETDRSKKGSVDEHVKKLLEIINAHPDYYSTSSCAGRILLLLEPESRKKNQYEWPYVTHEQAEVQPFLDAINECKDKQGRLWLRMQTVIIHVASRNLDAANHLLDQFYRHGWKRSGIFSTENDVMLELLSVEHLDVPIMENGKFLVDESYIEHLIAISNEKLNVCHEKIAAAEKRVKEALAA